MKITIHRGTHQIGGCVTEYEHNGHHLFVDYGETLPGEIKNESLEIEGFTKGDLSHSALFITHYHGDHIGRVNELPSELPIYIGVVAKEIQLTYSSHMNNKQHVALVERLNGAKTFTSGANVEFGPFCITPIHVNHSAFDAYAFVIEAEDVKVLHTGDFRMHGFGKEDTLQQIKKTIGERVDYVVCEGTNVARTDNSISEKDLQQQFVEHFCPNKGHIVYSSTTNIERLFIIYHAAIKAGLDFYVDEFQRQLMDIAVNSDMSWKDAYLFHYIKGHEPQVLFENFFVAEKFKRYLDSKGFVLIARANEQFDKLIERLPCEKVRYLSMWEGYVDSENAAYSANLAKSVGADYVYLHTSGHCNPQDMDEFFSQTNPLGIIPIHTDSPNDFVSRFSKKWPIILLNDGESIRSVSGSRYFDLSDSHIICVKDLDDDVSIVSQSDDEVCYGCDSKLLGFGTWNDVEFLVEHAVYKPDSFLGYQVMDEEDMEPFVAVTYDANGNVLMEYEDGCHEDLGCFSVGEKVLAIFPEYNAIVPSIIKGLITPESIKREMAKSVLGAHETYEEHIENMWEWDWDRLEVQPLVKLKRGNKEMSDTELVHRVDVFPYRRFERNV